MLDLQEEAEQAWEEEIAVDWCVGCGMWKISSSCNLLDRSFIMRVESIKAERWVYVRGWDNPSAYNNMGIFFFEKGNEE